MSTKKSAKVKIKNSTGGKALIRLFHANQMYGTWESREFVVDHGKTSDDTLTVYFPTGADVALVDDYWAIHVSVMNGDFTGIYGSKNHFSDPENPWIDALKQNPPIPQDLWGPKSCQLRSADAGKTMTFEVSSARFDINVTSGGTTDKMIRLRDYNAITHVFVLMLENRSFDHIFGKSGMSNIKVPASDASNTYDSIKYPFKSGALYRMTTDPGHEFSDVLEQLCGAHTQYAGGAYPKINNSGFASNYATSTTEGSAPNSMHYGDTMLGFDTAEKLPVINSLAHHYAICDHWFSSLPGPTWPNRFFLHGASSVGMDDSPSSSQMTTWETVSGFQYPKKSVFDMLVAAKLHYRIFADLNNSFSDDPGDGSKLGWIPQVGSLANISAKDAWDVADLGSKLNAPYNQDYTFIEPNYGDVYSGSFKGGSSQHPMDDTYGGEALIKHVYESIRNSPFWYSSMLVITYDEHGGFYDSAVPPATTCPNDMNYPTSYTKYKFDFKTLGVRVPAVVVSPLIKEGKRANSVYEHSSVPKTLVDIFKDSMHDAHYLTARDTNTQLTSLVGLLEHSLLKGDSMNNGPTSLPEPVKSLATPRDEPSAVAPTQPLPAKGNVIGFLSIALKTHVEITKASKVETQALMEQVRAIKTYGEAKEYVAMVTALVRAHWAERDAQLKPNSETKVAEESAKTAKKPKSVAKAPTAKSAKKK